MYTYQRLECFYNYALTCTISSVCVHVRVQCVYVSYSSKEHTVHDSWPHRFDVDIDTVGEHNLLDLVGVWINTPGHGKVERHNNRQQLLSTKINHTN